MIIIFFLVTGGLFFFFLLVVIRLRALENAAVVRLWAFEDSAEEFPAFTGSEEEVELPAEEESDPLETEFNPWLC